MLNRAFALIVFCVAVFAGPVSPQFNQNYGRIRLVFEETRGQADRQVRFVARSAAYSLFITDHEAIFSLRHAGAAAKVSVHLAGANAASMPQAEDLRESFSNY